MSLRTLAVLAVVLTLGLLGAAAGLYLYGYSNGHAAGAGEVQAKWDKAEEVRKDEAAKTARDGRVQADAYAAKVRELEAKNEQTAKRLRNALRAPVDCPKSGEIGDVLVPADVLRCMFNDDARCAPAD